MYYRENGKDNGSYYSMIGDVPGLYRENGQEDGDYYLGCRVTLGNH